MEKDIFAPYEIAKQLKELGFDEPCIAYYNPADILPEHPILYVSEKKSNSQEYSCISVPTWEQVFKWFREKGYHCYILQSDETLEYWGEIEGERSSWSGNFTKTYEQARENLVLELIELYGQRTNKK